MRRATTLSTPAPTDDAGESRHERRTREQLDDLARLGPIYGVMNQLAPLTRLYAICCLLFGSSEAFKSVLPLIITTAAINVARPLFFRLGGMLADTTTAAAASADGAEAEASLRGRQLQLVFSQAIKAVLLMASSTVALSYTNLDACGLAYDGGGDVSPLVEFGAIGVGGAAMMGLVWGTLQSYSPRENLAMADAAAGLSSATEDELLLGMKPLWRATSLVARCICVGLETAADVILIFAFLPAVVEGVETPTGGARQSLLAAAAASLTYGSQHLRFRNEWLVCMAFGAVLQGVTTALVGRRLLGLLVAVELFAIGRHLRRVGLDDRKFSAQ